MALKQFMRINSPDTDGESSANSSIALSASFPTPSETSVSDVVYGSGKVGVSGTIGDDLTEIGTDIPAQNDYDVPDDDYDAVKVSIQFGKPNGSTDKIFWKKDTPLIASNLVGEGGYFNVKIDYLKRSSVQYAGEDSPTYLGYSVADTKNYTIEQWIHKATGYEYDAEDGEWEVGNQPDAGFAIALEKGTINGCPTTGEDKITITYKCKLANGAYAVITKWFSANVGVWFSEYLGDEISLSVEKTLSPIYATLEDGMKIKLAGAGAFLLINIPSATQEFRDALDYSNREYNVVVKTDPDTGELHFFLYGTEIFGRVDNVVDGYSANMGDVQNGELVLFQDYDPPVEGGNNIEVQFPCYQPGMADRINKCHFGIMFGSNNARNRLFVSGNPDYPNADWHSGQISFSDGTQSKGLGYFEDLSECVYGATDNAVVGYDIVSNDKLLVLKGHSDKETTVYFRQPTLVSAVNSAGTSVTGISGEALYQEEFSLVMGNNSVAGISPKTILNFAGDSVFVSDANQLVGLDLAGIIGDNQRYANTRSAFIDDYLREEDMSDSLLWTDNDYLFLAMRNKLFVANRALRSDEQYEWFPISIQNVTSVMKKDGKIYLGKGDGGLYAFSDGFRDSEKVFVGYGLTKVSANKNTEIITSADSLASLEPAKEHWFRPIKDASSQYLYRLIGDAKHSSEGTSTFRVNNSAITLVCEVDGETDYDLMAKKLMLIKEGVPYYYQGSFYGLSADTPYYLKETDTPHKYEIYDEDGEKVTFQSYAFTSNQTFALYRRVEEPMKMADIDASNGTFSLVDDAGAVDIEQYGNQSMYAFKGEIVEYSPVKAIYVTKPYTLGGLEYRKTVWSFTLANDSGKRSELEVCLASNKIPSEDLKVLGRISSAGMGLDFGGFSFSKVDFDKNVVPRTYSSKRIVSGVKFACFAFRSLGESNSVLGALSITYTLPFPNYGGD